MSALQPTARAVQKGASAHFRYLHEAGIVCVDDHSVMLKGTKRSIEQILPDASIVAFTNAGEALAFVKENGCDVLISELELCGADGLTLAKSVKKLNSIPCGALDDVIDSEIEHLRLPKAITGEGEFFLLRARGESMIKAGIDNGDLVLIRKQETAKQGNIVAFLYDNEQTTLKRYKQTDDAIYLCPENDSMQPIVIRGEDRAKLRIQGVATGIIKKIEGV